MVQARTRSGDAVQGISRRRGGHAATDSSQKSKIAASVICVLVFYVVGSTIYESHFAGMFVPDVEVDEFGRSRVRRRPHRHRQRLDPNQPTTEMDAVLEGYLTLIDINIPSTALQGVGTYRGVTAKFCHIDWKLQQKTPHQVPMFNDLIRQSNLCDSTMITVDLWDITKQARAYDDQVGDDILPVPPTGVVFHESRCGSTLIANMLAAFSPDHTRVYSENAVHLNSLMACDVNPCHPELHQQLIQDVFYLSGRTVRKERPQYVFYKISSLGTMFIHSFTNAFPTVPWMYLYRDTVEVMQSHFVRKDGSAVTNRDRPVCLRLQTVSNANHQPATTIQIANSKQRDPMTLSKEEYCATHLAALSLSALQEYQRSHKGRFVNYNMLPDFVWDKLLPEDFGVTLDDAMIQRMKQISQNYSKARNKPDAAFSHDGETKRQGATPEIIAAAKTFASEIYGQLEALLGQGNN